MLRFGLAPPTTAERLVEVTRALHAGFAAGGVDVDVVVCRDHDAIRRAVAAGVVDAAFAPPVVCAWHEAAGGTVVARGLRSGAGTFASAIVGRAGVRLTPRALRAAWSAPWSTTGHLLPKAHLRARRHVVEGFFVAEHFCAGAAAAVKAVLDGDADVAAVRVLQQGPGPVAIALEACVAGASSALVPVAFTESVGGPGVIAARGVDGDALWRSLAALSPSVVRAALAVDGLERAPAGGYRALYALAPGEP